MHSRSRTRQTEEVRKADRGGYISIKVERKTERMRRTDRETDQE